jgi:hypothetical protein
MFYNDGNLRGAISQKTCGMPFEVSSSRNVEYVFLNLYLGELLVKYAMLSIECARLREYAARISLYKLMVELSWGIVDVQ